MKKETRNLNVNEENCIKTLGGKILCILKKGTALGCTAVIMLTTGLVGERHANAEANINNDTKQEEVLKGYNYQPGEFIEGTYERDLLGCKVQCYAYVANDTDNLSTISKKWLRKIVAKEKSILNAPLSDGRYGDSSVIDAINKLIKEGGSGSFWPEIAILSDCDNSIVNPYKIYYAPVNYREAEYYLWALHYSGWVKNYVNKNNIYKEKGITVGQLIAYMYSDMYAGIPMDDNVVQVILNRLGYTDKGINMDTPFSDLKNYGIDPGMVGEFFIRYDDIMQDLEDLLNGQGLRNKESVLIRNEDMKKKLILGMAFVELDNLHEERDLYKLNKNGFFQYSPKQLEFKKQIRG